MAYYVDRAFMAAYMGVVDADLPVDIDRLIEEAEELIDYYTLSKARFYFERSETEDPELYAGVRNAVASQVIWAMEIRGSELDKLSGVNSFSIGSFSVSFEQGKAAVKLLSPRTLRILQRLGLLYRGVRS